MQAQRGASFLHRGVMFISVLSDREARKLSRARGAKRPSSVQREAQMPEQHCAGKCPSNTALANRVTVCVPVRNLSAACVSRCHTPSSAGTRASVLRHASGTLDWLTVRDLLARGRGSQVPEMSQDLLARGSPPFHLFSSLSLSLGSVFHEFKSC